GTGQHGPAGRRDRHDKAPVGERAREPGGGVRVGGAGSPRGDDVAEGVAQPKQSAMLRAADDRVVGQQPGRAQPGHRFLAGAEKVGAVAGHGPGERREQSRPGKLGAAGRGGGVVVSHGQMLAPTEAAGSPIARVRRIGQPTRESRPAKSGCPPDGGPAKTFSVTPLPACVSTTYSDWHSPDVTCSNSVTRSGCAETRWKS